MAITHNERTASGSHLRLEHPTRGPVHVLVRAGARPTRYAVFVHGLRVTPPTTEWYVDQQWKQYGLQRAFVASGSSAVFIVPAARARRRDPVRWPDLRELIAFVREAFESGARDLAAGLGDGPIHAPIHAIGHSAAYVNLQRWLREPRLRHLTLLDALYGFVGEFAAYAQNPSVYFDLAVSANGLDPHRNAPVLLASIPEYETVTELGPLGVQRVLYLPIRRMAHLDWVTQSRPLSLFLARDEQIHAGGPTAIA